MKLIQGKYLLCALTAIFACGCSESEAVFSEDEPNPQYAIAIAANGSTETAVVDPDDDLRGLQHVTRVYLYIYEQDADGSDYTCVAGEEVDWLHREGAMTGLTTREQKYITKYQGYKDNVNYLFLAMGFDDTYTGTATNPTFLGTNSVAAYGQPDKIVNVRKGDKPGDKLSEGYFKLQEGADVKEIAHSELFAGSKVYTRAQLAGKGTAEINLYRRVAGVAGYFKNVPASIDGVKGVKEVAKVELRLYKSQNTQTYFLPKLPATGTYTSPGDVPDGEYVDYITSPYSYERDSSPVLASYTVGSDQDDNGEFTLSAYLLPIKSPGMFDAGESTLQLTFYDADGLYITHRRILQRLVTTRSGTGIDDSTDPKALRYPIRANHFYRIGTKQHPIDLSDSETTIYIEIDPIWDEYYGGAMDNEDYDKDSPGLGLDEEWGEHNGGKLKNEQTD